MELKIETYDEQAFDVVDLVDGPLGGTTADVSPTTDLWGKELAAVVNGEQVTVRAWYARDPKRRNRFVYVEPSDD